MAQTEIASSADVVAGKIHVAKSGQRSIALTRLDGEVRAFENKCPHLGLALAKGRIEDGAIVCPWHGSRFDICTGRNLDWVNSVLGLSMPNWSHKVIAMGKAPADVVTFAASEADGKVFVDLP